MPTVRFRALVPDEADVEVKPMFGNLGAFVHGHMFMGLFGADVGVKLEETSRSELAAMPGAGPFGPADQPMAGYVTLPADGTAAAAASWTAKAYATAAVLPAEAPKAPKAARP